MNYQAFLIDELTGETIFRYKTGAPEQLAGIAPEGQKILFYTGSGDIDTMETFMSPNGVDIRPLTVDAAIVLQVAMIDKKALVNALRDGRLGGACQTAKGLVDCNEKSMGFIRDEITMGSGDVTWIMANNQGVLHTHEEMVAMGQAVTAYRSAVVLYASALKDEIDTMPSLEDLAALNIEEGWPE